MTQLARERQIVLRTARRWVERYRKNGLAGLVRRKRNDKNERKLLPDLQQIIEGLALSRPKLSAAAVHRMAVEAAMKLGVNPPSYDVVYSLIRKLAPALVTMAHEGMKSYSESFDLVHRTEAEGPNAVWQADHTELDILVKDERGDARRPWLTIILDDYSRAVAQRGRPVEARVAASTSLPGDGCQRESDRGVVPAKPGNCGGGKVPDFWNADEDGEDQVIGDEP